MITEADTCRTLVLPKLYAAGWTDDQIAEQCRPNLVEYLELAPGEAALLHNSLLHSSDVNRTDVSRRAFSVCYMDGRTVSKSGEHFSKVF